LSSASLEIRRMRHTLRVSILCRTTHLFGRCLPCFFGCGTVYARQCFESEVATSGSMAKQRLCTRESDSLRSLHDRYAKHISSTAALGVMILVPSQAIRSMQPKHSAATGHIYMTVSCRRPANCNSCCARMASTVALLSLAHCMQHLFYRRGQQKVERA
jgi:hypothetical protein